MFKFMNPKAKLDFLYWRIIRLLITVNNPDQIKKWITKYCLKLNCICTWIAH